MFRNYLIVALRSIKRQKGYAAISIFGMAVAVACCVLILLFVRNEWSVNTQFSEVDRLYRVDSEWREETMGLSMTTLAPVGQTLVEAYPEVTNQVRLYLMSSSVRVGDESARHAVILADTTLFSLFDLPLLHGNAATALSQPRSVVIAEDLAEQFFGTSQAVGETLMMETWNNGWQPYTVTGVWKPITNNALTRYGGEHYKLIIPPYPFGDYMAEAGWTSWESRYIMQYVKLADGVAPGDVRDKLSGFIEAYAPEAFHGNLQLKLNPLRTLYLTDDGSQGWRLLQLLLVVGLLVLLIACINFTNLAVAQAFVRMKEVGVRKATGARSNQLIAQFMVEALVKSVLAILLGSMLASIFLGPFFAFFQKEVGLAALWDGTSIGMLLGLSVLVALVAGAYPAFVLSTFQPIKALAGKAQPGSSASWIRRALVVAQCSIAIVLLVSVFTITRQLTFIAEKDLGFDKEQVLVIRSVPRIFNEEGVVRMTAVRDRLAAMSAVRSASLSWETAGENSGNTLAVSLTRQADASTTSITRFVVDSAFLDTYGLTLTAGRFFDDTDTGDRDYIVLNERAAQSLGWTSEEAVGQVVYLPSSPEAAETYTGHVVLGVVADHHFQSMHVPIRPLLYLSVASEQAFRVLGLKLASGELSSTVAAVEAAWDEVLPGAPFEYTFLDDQVNRIYRAEQWMQQLIGFGAALAIFISCIGMLGLASLRIAQRTKEIGIRKAIGASVSDIVTLLSRDVLTTTLVAALIAFPIAWLAMQYWLETFTYRVHLSVTSFALAGALVVLTAWIAVSYHTLHAALANPIKALRHE